MLPALPPWWLHSPWPLGEVNNCIVKPAVFCSQTQAHLEKKAPSSATVPVLHNRRTSSNQPHKFPPPQNSNCGPRSFPDRAYASRCLSSVVKYYISSFFCNIEQKEKSCSLALSQGFPNSPGDKNHPGHFLKCKI